MERQLERARLQVLARVMDLRRQQIVQLKVETAQACLVHTNSYRTHELVSSYKYAAICHEISISCSSLF